MRWDSKAPSLALGALTGFVALGLGLVVLGGCNPDGRASAGVDRDGAWPADVFHPPAPEPEPLPPDPRTVWPPKAVWVVRHAWSSPEEIAALMEACQSAGFNTVHFQVRGNGTAFYRSHIEPFAEEYRNGDPGFDPLAVACREAHRRGMALHAWVNVMPGWKGLQPPRSPEQLWYKHPEWFLQDQHGRRQPLSGFYVSLNPCLPEVRQYLVSVLEEIVRNYSVDGLHLDYIRIPNEESPKGSDYPRDPRTLWIFKRDTGETPQNKAAWTRWRTQQVTQLVRDIRAMTRRVRPGLKLTASCLVDYERARRDHFQDGPGWLNAGLVDLAFTMNYTANTQVFRQRQEAWRRAAGLHPVAVGIEASQQPAARSTLEQVRLGRMWGGGLAIFSDQILFATPRATAAWTAALRPALLSPQPRSE